MAKAYFSTQPRTMLPGSEKAGAGAVPETIARHAMTAGGAKSAGAARVSVSLLLRPKAAYDVSERLTRAQFARAYGADPASLKVVKAFAAEFGLRVVSEPAKGRRELVLAGSEGAMQKAFGVELSQHEVGGRWCRVRSGGIYLPEEVTGHVTAVLGLDNRPQAKPHSRVARPHAANASFTPVQVGALYGFPAGAKATGQTIGLIELGGGFRKADITAYFKSLGMTAPAVKAVGVDKGKNAPGAADSADGEVMLDIEVAGAVAPGAKIAVYFAPNTDQGFIDAIAYAVHDTVNHPSVVSISWGGPESTWTGQALAALDSACQAAAILGVTITVASGDNGSGDGVSDGANHVDFPAASPHVLACGGTKLTGSGGSITAEVVWNETAANEGATGGGVSNVFPLPAWQQAVGVPKPAAASGGRGVPDVAGDADPATGYVVRVDGQSAVYGGTSAVAPLWAGLIALANAKNGKSAGFVNPLLYAKPGAFRDITSGNNGAFQAATGWDACTGLGSPNAPLVIAALGAAKVAKPVKKAVKATTKVAKKAVKNVAKRAVKRAK